MSPLRWIRENSSLTAATCVSSVVLMKRSHEIPRRRHTSTNLGLISSQYCWGAMPRARAAVSTFALCSSTPIRKNVSVPFSRM